MYNTREYNYYNLVNGASPSVTAFTGKGILHSIIICSPSPTALTITDSGSPIIVMSGAPTGTVLLDVPIARSLVINAASSPSIVVTYTQG